MSELAWRLPAHPSLEQLQKQAKDLLRQYRTGESAALQRFQTAIPRFATSGPTQRATLADAQFIIAREHGFDSWAKLKHYILGLPVLQMAVYEKLAQELAAAHMNGDTRAIREINRNYHTEFVADFHDSLTMQRRLTTWFASDLRTPELALIDARQMVAHAYGLQNWSALVESVTPGSEDHLSATLFITSSPPFYEISWQQNKLTVKGPQSEKDWETIFAAAAERGITKLEAGGLSDLGMKLLAEMKQVTHIRVNSDALTDKGLKELRRMPQLRELEIGGSRITDSGLEVLRQLPDLRRFQSCWTPGISDSGVANLSFCNFLESVDLMGTAAGDGLIRALAGKSNLRQLKTGRGVTDAGIKLLHDIPCFTAWRGEEIHCGLMSAEAQPNHLLIDGPFTDAGLAELVGLDGLFGLSFFSHSRAFTSAGLAALRLLPNLGFLGCPGASCNDDAMRQIAAIPRLMMLMGQGAVASDKGWEALSRSPTIEYIWGRECPNFTGRGFAALAKMPALRGLGISCKNVDHASLSELPNFPALRQFVPMDFRDTDFRHVGRCENLEELWCMYCRDTTDTATEHIGQLPRLRTYYAGMTQVTDRTPELLSHIDSLERIEFWACRGITDTGISYLTALPLLREIVVKGSPGVSMDVLKIFSTQVHVEYSA